MDKICLSRGFRQQILLCRMVVSKAFHSTEVKVWGPVIQNRSQNTSHSVGHSQLGQIRNTLLTKLFCCCSWTIDHRQKESGLFTTSIISSAFLVNASICESGLSESRNRDYIKMAKQKVRSIQSKFPEFWYKSAYLSKGVFIILWNWI